MNMPQPQSLLFTFRRPRFIIGRNIRGGSRRRTLDRLTLIELYSGQSPAGTLGSARGGKRKTRSTMSVTQSRRDANLIAVSV